MQNVPTPSRADAELNRALLGSASPHASAGRLLVFMLRQPTVTERGEFLPEVLDALCAAPCYFADLTRLLVDARDARSEDEQHRAWNGLLGHLLMRGRHNAFPWRNHQDLYGHARQAAELCWAFMREESAPTARAAGPLIIHEIYRGTARRAAS